jgi:hypothetical protein
MTVRQLLSSLDSQELTEWAAFVRVEKDPPEAEPFYSDDPNVMADKMREILSAPGNPRGNKRRSK